MGKANTSLLLHRSVVLSTSLKTLYKNPKKTKKTKKKRSSTRRSRERTMKQLNLALQICLTTSLILLQLVTCSNLTPTPNPWPDQFHALLFMNLSTTKLQLSDLWYDWPKGRNVNIFQKQLGEVLYDVEWNNGTSFYYTIGENGACEVMEFEVGIPRPDFLLDGAHYLGTEVTDGFLCNVWEKVDFIWYYEDVYTRRPVRWDFYDGTYVIHLNYLQCLFTFAFYLQEMLLTRMLLD